jgi:hypothetical protein
MHDFLLWIFKCWWLFNVTFILYRGVNLEMYHIWGFHDVSYLDSGTLGYDIFQLSSRWLKALQRSLWPPSAVYNWVQYRCRCRKSGQLEQGKGDVLKSATCKEGPEMENMLEGPWKRHLSGKVFIKAIGEGWLSKREGKREASVVHLACKLVTFWRSQHPSSHGWDGTQFALLLWYFHLHSQSKSSVTTSVFSPPPHVCVCVCVCTYSHNGLATSICMQGSHHADRIQF